MMDEHMLELTGLRNVDVTFFTDDQGFAVHVSGHDNDGYVRLTEAQAIELRNWLTIATHPSHGSTLEGEER